MRFAAAISLFGWMLSSCGAVASVKHSDPQVHVWSLVEMKNLEEAFDAKLHDNYVRVSDPEEINQIQLETIYDQNTGNIVGRRFSGCNGLINRESETFKNDWVITGKQVGCTTLVRRVDEWGVLQETQETAYSLRQLSEFHFLELASLIDETSVDWDAGLYTYLDRRGEPLMTFEMKERVK